MKPLDPQKILKLIDKPRKLVVFNSTASTNDVAWEYARSAKADRLCVLAEYQSKGRGRRANRWLAENRESLLCSIILKKVGLDAEIVTLASSIGVAEGIGFCGNAYPRIKWPNDVLINGKKVAGILVESRINEGEKDFVIGFGINCHQGNEQFEKAGLATIATSLDIEHGVIQDRNAVAARVMNRMDYWLEQAAIDCRLVIQRWRELSSQLGHRVKVKFKNHVYAGNCINVDPVCGLVLQLDRGGVRMFDAAHSTIVKEHATVK